MNVAVLHYHLNRGGVTRVVENQLASLDAVLAPSDPWRVALIHGGRREGFNEDLCAGLNSVRVSLHEVPRLDYDDQRENDVGGPEKLSSQLAAALAEAGFDPQETVVHVHNHSLGKNGCLPGDVLRLAENGYAILLQIHDFAEDFRPANYARIRDLPAATLYPQSENIHYAVLNGRDYAILQEAGVEPGRLHALPNPVPPLDHLPSKSDARDRLAQRFGVAEHQRFVLYPVRCIRRKNVGEALLFSALAPSDTVVGLTLPPLNPAEVPIYEAWKQLSAELELSCRFEVGAPGGLTFAENLAAADLILTTSLAEGFGMVFLESWLAGHSLVGRDLPEITPDFVEMGLRFDWLRPRVDVPVEWVEADAFQQTVLEAYRRTLEAYGREEPEDLSEKCVARTAGGLVDFGDLDETLQQHVLRIIRDCEENRRRVLQCNRWIEQSLAACDDDISAVIAKNALAINGHLSRVPSGRRLLDVYRRVAASPRNRSPKPLPHGQRILDRFLDFTRFRPIRS